MGRERSYVPLPSDRDVTQDLSGAENEVETVSLPSERQATAAV
ncbi:hypothetical protein [Haloarcula rubripromontorii]|nr:hypothetical protein [Haloarcula rubripromontorii]